MQIVYVCPTRAVVAISPGGPQITFVCKVTDKPLAKDLVINLCVGCRPSDIKPIEESRARELAATEIRRTR
ncbi:MAG: hypothetical protein AAB421_04895 [Patescibacteria group bacterium]